MESTKNRRPKRGTDEFEQWHQNRYGVSTKAIEDKVLNRSKKGKGYPGLKAILSYFKPERKRYFWGFLLLILVAFVSLLGPISLQHIIDNVTIGEYTLVLAWAAVNVADMVFSRGMWYLFYGRIIPKANNNVAHNIRTALTKAALNTTASKYDKMSSGEVINRINNDPNLIAYNFGYILDVLCSIIECVVFVIYSFFINVWLALTLLVVALINFLIYNIYNRRYAKRNITRDNLLRDKNTSEVNEMVRGSADIKNLNLKSVMMGRLNRVSRFRVNGAVDSANQRQKYRQGANIVAALLLFGFFGVGVALLNANMITLGGFLAILIYRFYANNLFGFISDVQDRVRETEVAASRVAEILDEKEYPKEKFGSAEIKKIKGAISFNKVKFSYLGNSNVFKSLSFKVKAGETIGIVGKSGQGKSTIINLISKLYEPNGGKVRIDGIDVATLSEASLRGIVSVVPQNPYIFNLSVRENLLLIKPDATDSELVAVCKKAQIHDFFESKPDGYDTMIGEGGITLSGGQRQRLAIARALLKDSKILLLDEATSALDNQSQNKVKEVIHALAGECTIIIVAHRLTTVVDCDRIFVLDEGELVADGKHHELIENCPEYWALYSQEDKHSVETPDNPPDKSA